VGLAGVTMTVTVAMSRRGALQVRVIVVDIVD
jgi:hypothetical protein